MVLQPPIAPSFQVPPIAPTFFCSTADLWRKQAIPTVQHFFTVSCSYDFLFPRCGDRSVGKSLSPEHTCGRWEWLHMPATPALQGRERKMQETSQNSSCWVQWESVRVKGGRWQSRTVNTLLRPQHTCASSCAHPEPHNTGINTSHHHTTLHPCNTFSLSHTLTYT